MHQGVNYLKFLDLQTKLNNSFNYLILFYYVWETGK